MKTQFFIAVYTEGTAVSVQGVRLSPCEPNIENINTKTRKEL